MSEAALKSNPEKSVKVIRGQRHKFIVWGYDREINGPMLPWALAALRERLPAILCQAGAMQLADQVQQQGWDKSVLGKVEQAMIEAHARTIPGTDMIQEGRDWYARWKRIHPHFNTVDD